MIVITCMTKTPVIGRVAKDASKVEGERVKVNVRKCGRCLARRLALDISLEIEFAIQKVSLQRKSDIAFDVILVYLQCIDAYPFLPSLNFYISFITILLKYSDTVLVAA